MYVQSFIFLFIFIFLLPASQAYVKFVYSFFVLVK